MLSGNRSDRLNEMREIECLHPDEGIHGLACSRPRRETLIDLNLGKHTFTMFRVFGTLNPWGIRP